MLVDERKPFACEVDGIEVHGTVVQQPWNRTIGEKTLGIYHYEVSLIVAGMRKYRFTLHPDFSDDNTPHYKVLNTQRLSAVRDHIMEHIALRPLARPIEQAFEEGVRTCVVHFNQKPPVFPVPVEAQVGEV